MIVLQQVVPDRKAQSEVSPQTRSGRIQSATPTRTCVTTINVERSEPFSDSTKLSPHGLRFHVQAPTAHGEQENAHIKVVRPQWFSFDYCPPAASSSTMTKYATHSHNPAELDEMRLQDGVCIGNVRTTASYRQGSTISVTLRWQRLAHSARSNEPTQWAGSNLAQETHRKCAPTLSKLAGNSARNNARNLASNSAPNFARNFAHNFARICAGGRRTSPPGLTAMEVAASEREYQPMRLAEGTSTMRKVQSRDAEIRARTTQNDETDDVSVT
eukprot:6199739-Pleurochrysis_carterae.AAC.1